MHDMALYRKYRPSDFESVVGQDHVVEVLATSIKKKTVAHAYIFAGGRGIGKTSIARIFAKELGVHADDISEIDAASNRGIDDIRALRDAVHTLPFHSPYKVYVIDEVHMLTKDAWNALLKTLEEPPAHVIFMLATTDPDKIPDTIVSRCQLFTLKKPSEKVLAHHAIAIAKKEGYTLKEDGANLIALLGDGSFRDMLGALQKAMTVSKDKMIDMGEISEVLGAPNVSHIKVILKGIADMDMEPIVSAVASLESIGADAQMSMKILLSYFRTLLLLRVSKEHEAKVLLEQFSESDQVFFQGIVAQKSKTIQSASLVVLLENYDLMKTSPLPYLPLELACAKIVGE